MLSPPRQQFELNLCHYTLYGWVGAGGSFAVVIACLMAATALPQLALPLMLVLGGGGFYGWYRLMQKIVLHPALLIVEPDHLTVHYLPVGKVLRIPFAEVVSYRDEFLRDGRELRFRLQSGRKVKLAINTFLGPAGDYAGLVQAIKQAATPYQQQSPGLMAREKSFFEKPLATVLLIAASALALLMLGDIFFRHKPLSGLFITELGVLLTYGGLWYAARARRAG